MSEPGDRVPWPAPVGFGAWDSREIGRPGLLRLGDAWWLFHAGCDSRFEWRIGAAVSTDGVAWQRLVDEPLLVPPTTRRDGGGWHSYLDPSAVAEPDGRIHLFFAAQADRQGTRILSASTHDALDWSAPSIELEPPTVPGAVVDLRAPSVLVTPDEGTSLFVARVETRGDGSRETALLRCARADGIWRPTGATLRDPAGGEVDHPCVVRLRDGGWRLWCSSFHDGSWRILTATSPDLGSWTPLEPALEGDRGSPYETAGVFGPAVLPDRDGFLMLHLASSRTSDGMSVAVFARRSEDAATWQRLTERPVFHARPGIPVRPW